ncbi:MAG: hypothetical protein GTO45_36015 [Candidatus Aminicenantes bacterium]|nr:hypothetical protein [Candidatus Aminicenantes bacterium]NIM84109.1 hypothetical protein [Candidatus Aminicenantes bacterium]NIN17246.1 hypothetical protein [Candidatus Aminicenantes bacterium]NIN47264.1 hypothetical protein [Candidatus Aminicenantes bacterium]NIN90191.1 hypothetical protein [Candidatus Aminicenantes bacterium]
MKSKILKWSLLFIFLLVVSVVLGSCFWKKAKYDPESFQNAVILKEEALELMAKAGESYYKYRKDVYGLMSAVERSYEHARQQRKNDVIIGAWDRLRNPAEDRLGGFMEEWKKEDKLAADTINTFKEWVSKEFDAIKELEEAKKK